METRSSTSSKTSWTPSSGNRRKAYDYGYLRSNGQILVSNGPYITIAPVNPGYIVVPYYDPGIVFVAPRPGFVVGGGIRFGFGITIGAFSRPWGWGYSRFDWGGHAVFINNAPWRRTLGQPDDLCSSLPECPAIYTRTEGSRAAMNWNSAPTRSGKLLKKDAGRRKSITRAGTITAATNTKIRMPRRFGPAILLIP